MVKFELKGGFKPTLKFLDKLRNAKLAKVLEKYGPVGVEALSKATPKRTGTTADSWTYEIQNDGDKVILKWDNTNVNDGVSIAVILQYGHGTRNGGYVQGIDYINPALKPIFEEIAKNAYKEAME